LNAYYSLEAADEDVKAKRSAAETATTFLANVKEQVRIGSLAPSETINAESLAITAQQALVDSETTLQQQEIQLKNLLSRNGTADPVLAGARILPVDPIRIPEHDDLPPLEDLVKQALANRTDLASERENEAAEAVSNLGTKNGVLPFAVVFGSESQAGIAGTGRTVSRGWPNGDAPNPYFVGGIGTALGQVFRRDFPSESVTGAYEMTFRNRQALSDYAIDQLTFRQTQLSNRKDLNQVQVDVQNYLIALRQARARYEAAVRNRTLQEQLYSSERRRFELGANTGTLAKSTMNAKTAAATSVPPTTNMGRGVMAIPQVASVEAISRSTTDDPTSHRLGTRGPHALAFAIRIGRRLIAEHDGHEGQVLSASIPKPRRNLAMARTAVQKTSSRFP
jgi:outer membrane protein